MVEPGQDLLLAALSESGISPNDLFDIDSPDVVLANPAPTPAVQQSVPLSALELGLETEATAAVKQEPETVSTPALLNVRAAVVHKMLQRGSFPWDMVLQEWTAPMWVPHVATGPTRKPVSVWASLCKVTASFGHIHLLWCGVVHGLQVDICSTVDLHGLQGNNLLHHRLQRILCSSTWSTCSTFLLH